MGVFRKLAFALLAATIAPLAAGCMPDRPDTALNWDTNNTAHPHRVAAKPAPAPVRKVARNTPRPLTRTAGNSPRNYSAADFNQRTYIYQDTLAPLPVPAPVAASAARRPSRLARNDSFSNDQDTLAPLPAPVRRPSRPVRDDDSYNDRDTLAPMPLPLARPTRPARNDDARNDDSFAYQDVPAPMPSRRPTVRDDDDDVPVVKADRSTSSRRAPTRVTYVPPAAQDDDDQPDAPRADSRPVESRNTDTRRDRSDSDDAPAPPPSYGNGPVAFAWPVSGHVISGFGSNENGGKNDGINIAVPLGTPIRAAASGTVTYAGNELKGYGNLILIKHPGGYTTAYAHADRLVVGRNDFVAKGQVIGYAGQTGDVTSPQLHFEIRSSTTPVNPRNYLASQSARS